jgi:hypothetical protein
MASDAGLMPCLDGIRCGANASTVPLRGGSHLLCRVADLLGNLPLRGVQKGLWAGCKWRPALHLWPGPQWVRGLPCFVGQLPFVPLGQKEGQVGLHLVCLSVQLVQFCMDLGAGRPSVLAGF